MLYDRRSFLFQLTVIQSFGVCLQISCLQLSAVNITSFKQIKWSLTPSQREAS